jgi:probable rRNA maturation factor
MTSIEVQIASEAAGIPPPDEIRRWVEYAASRELRGSDAEIAVRVVDEPEMQMLNRDYRDQDKPTNVLSFPAGDVEGLPVDVSRVLGDIVVCATVVAREAAEQGKRPSDHWGHMLVHGVLHLLGHDHMTPSEAVAMEGLERTILAGLGIADPYE